MPQTIPKTEAEIFISHQNPEKLEREDEIFTTILNEKCPECSNNIQLHNFIKFNKVHNQEANADYSLICPACHYVRHLN